METRREEHFWAEQFVGKRFFLREFAGGVAGSELVGKTLGKASVQFPMRFRKRRQALVIASV